MDNIEHKSADASHYDTEANSYDLMNDKRSLIINKTLHKLLKDNCVHSVLDLACGTGSQAIYLHNKGYNVVAYDINAKMLRKARQKLALMEGYIEFKKGDMRLTHAGKFDAVITIFNAIGHLTIPDFIKTIQNIYHNLNPNGIYIFDIFNLQYLLHKDNITKLTIDWLKSTENKSHREIQYSTIDATGVLASFDTYIESSVGKPAKISHAVQTLQTYSRKQLHDILSLQGFKLHSVVNPDGSRFSSVKSERMLVVAKKRK